MDRYISWDLTIKPGHSSPMSCQKSLLQPNGLFEWGLDVWYIWDAINKLVGSIPTPLKNMSQLGRSIPYIMENKTCSKPPTSKINTSTWLCSTRFNKKHLGGTHVYKATHTPLLAINIRILGRDRKLKKYGIHWPTKVEVPTVGWLHLRLCW